jgi:predicted MFS family arabinose efflux permease
MGETRQGRNPWWIVVGSVLGLIVGNGPILQFTFGLFLGPIAAEFGWERGTISAALMCYAFLGAAASPLIGLAIDRWGVRQTTMLFILLFGMSTAAIAFTSSAPMFIALYGLAGIIGAGQAPLPYARAIAANFNARRGLALGIAMAGVGLGAALIPALTHFLIDSYGWREAYIGLGIVTVLVAFPAVAFLVGDAKSTAETSGELPGLTVAQALRDRRFWYMAIAFLLVATATNGTIAHAVPLLIDHHVPMQQASRVLSFAGLALIVGRLLSGYLIDRIFAPYIATTFFLIPIIGIALLGSQATVATSMLGIVCVGLGLGAEVDLIAFLLSRYLGLKSFGRLYGLLFAMFSVGSGLGPVIMGKVFDASKSYNGALVMFAVSLVIACACMSLLGPYQYPVAWRSRSAGDIAKRDGSASDAVGDEVVLAEQP